MYKYVKQPNISINETETETKATRGTAQVS